MKKDEQITKQRNEKLEKLYENVLALYDQMDYRGVILIFEAFLKLDNIDVLYYEHFNFVADIYIFASLSYLNLYEYEKALDVLINFEEQYNIIKNYYSKFIKYTKKNVFSKDEQEHIKNFISIINNGFNEFNKTRKIKFYNNLAYCYYKNKKYAKAVNYYESALRFNCSNLQLLTGKAQSLYELYNHKLPKEVKDTLFSIINKIQYNKQDYSSMFDCYLAIAKITYFLGNSAQALNYLSIALKFLNTDNNAECKDKQIYAYDWISRIAYKEKQYSTAAIFYEKIIDCLIQNKGSFIEHETIHPKPELSKMLKFLNETKRKVIDADIHYTNKSIWVGLIVGALFGSCQLFQVLVEYFKYNNNKSFIICIIVFAILTAFGYIFIDKFKK